MLRTRVAAVAVMSTALLIPAVSVSAATVPAGAVAVSSSSAVVKSGDTLSGLAYRWCGSAAKWPQVYAANRSVIGGNPHLIRPGQRLNMVCATTPVLAAPRTPATPTALSGWVHPLPGATCVSGWGAPRSGHSHKGVDLPRRSGTPIRAVHAGKVVTSTWQGGAGWYVVVDHGRYNSVYMHMRARSPLPVGRTVKAGQTIGYVGSTGDSSGPHLHFEIHDGAWHPVNPSPFLRARGVRVGC